MSKPATSHRPPRGHQRERALQAPAVLRESEADFATWCEDLLTRFGWQWVHSRPAKTEKGYRTALSGSPGYPDYHAIGPENTVLVGMYRRQVVVEIKAEDGKVTPEQRMWLDLFMLAGVETYLLRPSDREEFAEMIVLGHAPNLIELAECRCAWVNRRNEA